MLKYRYKLIDFTESVDLMESEEELDNFKYWKRRNGNGIGLVFKKGNKTAA